MDLRVKVKVGARKERLAELKSGKFEIDVKEKAEQNAANERVRTLIARHFHVASGNVRIVAGHHRPNKTFRVIK